MTEAPALDPVPTAADDGRPAALEVDRLGVTFGSVEVLRDIEITVQPGEFVCIVGPSGVGKTTMIRCIAGLLAPTAGSVLLDGETIGGPPEKLALVSQDYSRSLMPWLKVGENVRIPLRGKGLSKRAQWARVREAVAAVGLEEVTDAYPWQLSGGMQQRVAIARALAYQPHVLLMDEPFASVDAQTRADLEDLALAVQRESRVTIVLVTHDIDESVYLADRVIVLGGRPAAVRREIAVELGRERDQLETKSSAAFIACRAEVLKSVREAQRLARQGDR
jgi:NitT/TauT family transport system ATP-binding protein